MVTEHPGQAQIPGLRQLWKLAFGDSDAFLDVFFESAFSSRRCCCVSQGDTVAAALYWFDCEAYGQKIAYLYAVATHPAFRGRGLCRALMVDTHAILASRGYAGAILVPQEPGLRSMYAAMGYRECSGVSEIFASAGAETVALRPIETAEYALLRRKYLPAGGVVQEGENLALLERMARFYAGEDFLLASSEQKGAMWGMELLGNQEAAPGILKALDHPGGTFRCPGGEKPFAMFLPLTPNAKAPAYFGHAFD